MIQQLIPKTPFKVVELNNLSLPTVNASELVQFKKEVAELQRSIAGSSRIMGEVNEKLDLIEHAIRTYPGTDLSLLKEVERLRNSYHDCTVKLWGDGIRANNEFETVPSITNRIGIVEYQLFANRSGMTKTQQTNKAIAEEEYKEFRISLDDILVRIKSLESKLEVAKIPYIKGKDERWKED